MAITYDNQRVAFERLSKRYREYVALYRTFNNGSLEGVTPFDIFYWQMTYLSKYADQRSFGNSGY